MQALSQDIPFVLFSSCFLTKGASRSIIVDTQRSKYNYIPNALYNILKTFNGKTISEIKVFYQNEYDSIIDEYFEYLIENNCVFFTGQPERFPEINFNYNPASQITNAIIHVDSNNINETKKAVIQLDGLGCKAILIKAFSKISFDEINTIIEFFKDTGFQFIELILRYDKDLNDNDLKNLFYNELRLFKIVLHSAYEEKTVVLEKGEGRSIFYTQDKLSINSCGNISPSYFAINLNHISEAHGCNTCLNRKISIDEEGKIKSCPSMAKEYGNIKNDSLKDILLNSTFKENWTITKEKIDVCKDCEHRFICSDCRAFIGDSENIYSKPSKCFYNPYLAKWKGEDGYISEKNMLKEEIEFIINDNV